jgi:haloalkane dehalogenase
VSLATRRLPVLDSHVSWYEAGEGEPLLFLHGNPTSSYLWRNIIPALAPLGRCIAPDLIGFGDSGRLPGAGNMRYGLDTQRAYLDAFLDALDIRERLTLVIHDWGSVVGFDWANRHREAVRGIAYMEAVVRPVSAADLGEQTVAMFETLRSPTGEQLILQENMYIEQALPATVLRALTPEEMAAYRAPFAAPGEGQPQAVWDAEAGYAAWLPEAACPKLFVNAEPGAFLVGDKRDACRVWRNQEEVTVPGLHFLQEDSPELIGAALAAWFARLPL